jgi:hypothetical protein
MNTYSKYRPEEAVKKSPTDETTYSKNKEEGLYILAMSEN